MICFQLQLEVEYEELRNLLSERKRQIRFKMEIATPETLQEVAIMGCRMLHISCHGKKLKKHTFSHHKKKKLIRDSSPW